MASREEAAWQSRRLAIEDLGESGANNVESLSSLNLFLVAATDCVHLVSAEDGLVLRTFQTGKMLPRPLKCAYSCHRLSQPGSTGLTSFTVGYVEADSRDCILRTFVPPDDCDAIYLQTPTEPRSSDWCTWDSAKETSKRIADPGAWEVVSDGSAVGVRHKQPPGKDSRGSHSSGLRNRYAKRGPEPDPFEGWEVWTASPGGRPEADECRRLIQDGEQANHLLITELGPKVKVGLNSVAFAFGDMIKLVIVGGPARLKDGPDDATRESLMNTGSRRRKPGTVARTRAPS